MWITKFEFAKCNTNKEALEIALNTINKWCNDNQFTYELTSNTEIGSARFNGNFNRCISIKTNDKAYCYQLIIHHRPIIEYHKEYDEASSILFGEECYINKQVVTGDYYQAELIRRI